MLQPGAGSQSRHVIRSRDVVLRPDWPGVQLALGADHRLHEVRARHPDAGGHDAHHHGENLHLLPQDEAENREILSLRGRGR